MSAGGGVLSIVIPAYNEEDAIKDIAEKCLGARAAICRETGLSRVEVIAVDDGSRDQTREIAGAIGELKLVVHPVNRGYGQALMTGFEAASGDYLSFLDADGTCDPMAFIGLYRALAAGKADMAVGNRMHADSQMPRIRALGNRIYAFIISKLSGVPIGDSASGMRIFSRRLLARLYPLPTGLHFTPAMTARAACMGAKIVEVPIPYAERQGQSKLRVVSDGIRFLRVILGIIFAYYPLRIFGPAGLACAAIAAGYALFPVSYYLRHGNLAEWMIYRLLTIVTLLVCAMICLTFGWIAQRISDIAVQRQSGFIERRWVREAALGAGAVLWLGGILLNCRTILEYASSGHVTIHWVYVLAGSLAVILGTVLAAFAVTMGLVGHLPYALERKEP